MYAIIHLVWAEWNSLIYFMTHPQPSALNQACPCPPAVNTIPQPSPQRHYTTPPRHSLRLPARHSLWPSSLRSTRQSLFYPCLIPQPVLSGYPGAAASHRGSLRSVSPCSLTAASPSLRSGHAGHPAPSPQAKPVTHSTKGYAGYRTSLPAVFSHCAISWLLI